MSDSLITKKAIAAGLKELTKKKSFDKITIADITEACGLNRQTFYYHFQDKFELADWIYYNEAVSIIVEDINYENWDQKVLELLTKMKSESYFYENTLKLSIENGFREYLFRITSELFRDIIDLISVNEKQTFLPEDKAFVCEFYAFGIVGVIISWAQHGMKDSPENIARHLKSVYLGTQKFVASRMIDDEKKEQV